VKVAAVTPNEVENEKLMISWLLCEVIAQMCSHKCRKHNFFLFALFGHGWFETVTQFIPGPVSAGTLNAVVRKRRSAPAHILKHGEPWLKT
jgi:hypothetical protein